MCKILLLEDDVSLIDGFSLDVVRTVKDAKNYLSKREYDLLLLDVTLPDGTGFNIINSVSMSVSARMKQYGAMRAVGMDMAQMKRMLYAETFTYAISGILAGVVLGIPLHRFSWQNLIYNQWNDPWIFPVLALIIIIALVIVSCILAVRNPLKRIESMSVVDVLSEQ